MTIYVGNLPESTSQIALKRIFERYGKVGGIKLMRDRETNKFRGFAFVDMPIRSEAENAINNLNYYDFEGKNIKVNPARPRSTHKRQHGFQGFGW